MVNAMKRLNEGGIHTVDMIPQYITEMLTVLNKDKHGQDKHGHYETWTVPDIEGRYRSPYGYWLLGIAFTKLSQSRDILYIGSGGVGCCEQSFHFHENKHISQIYIETEAFNEACGSLGSYNAKSVFI
jgi:hypothetical protein